MPSSRRGARCEWIVADGGGRGGGASSTFGLVRQTAEDHHRALARFRSDACRVLVATQVLAEGIDVPECQLVVGFDAPDTSRELTQWRGRARAAEPRYLHMAANGDGGAHIERLRRLAEATHRAAAAWDLGSAPASFDWPTSDAIVEAETGATMPEEEAKSYLHSRVYEMSFGDGEIDLSEKHFSERTNFWMSEPDAAGAYSCTVLLEPVLLCEVKSEVDGDDLVVVEGGEAVRRAPRRVSSGACSTKDAAKAAAALAGCRTLRKLGVLDAHLLVAGRARLRRELLADHRPPTRSTRRANAYELAAKEVHVRSLPRCLTRPANGRRTEWWLHRMNIGGAPSTLALLLPAEAPRDPFVVRGDSVQLTLLRSLSLDDDEQRLVVEWLRGSLDLVMRVSLQAAAEREKCGAEPGEPLDESLGAPRRLIAHTLHGAYEAARLDAATGAAVAPAAEATAAKLTADARKAAAEAAEEKLVVVLDLDRTLWQGSAADFADDDAFARFKLVDGRRDAVVVPDWAGDADRTAHLDLFPEVRGVIELLRDAGCTVALASLGHATAAKALLRTFALPLPLRDGAPIVDPDDDEACGLVRIGAGVGDGKAWHLQQIADAVAGGDVEQLLLFDDDRKNVGAAEALGATGHHIDHALGLTAEALLEGLQKALGRRGDDAFTPHELELRKAGKKEAARKERQSRQAAEVAKIADRHASLAQARLDAIAVAPGCWLAAPLVAGGEAQLDWPFMREAVGCYATCAWPSVQQAVERSGDPGAGLLGAPALDVEPRSAQGVSLECCALVRTSERQWKLLTAVELDHENAAVSGYAQTRTLKTGKAHLLRWHDAATKKYLTHADALERGHLAADARALPLRSAHVDALRMLRPLLWRLEHVALGEDAAAQPVDVPADAASASAQLSSTMESIPLSLRCAALSHKNAACGVDYEVLEFVGDAGLDLLAVVTAMAARPQASEGELTIDKAEMVRNMTLYRRGTLLGLPAVCLQRLFDKEKQLPELRKRLLSKKEIADLVEAILGAAWEAAARDAVGLTPGQPLADGALNTLITSSLPFFQQCILPPEKSIGSPSFDELLALACKEQIDEWNEAQPTAPGSPGAAERLLGCHFERHPWLRSAVAGRGPRRQRTPAPRSRHHRRRSCARAPRTVTRAVCSPSSSSAAPTPTPRRPGRRHLLRKPHRQHLRPHCWRRQLLRQRRFHHRRLQKCRRTRSAI